MNIWDREQTGSVISTTGWDEKTKRVVTILSQDVEPIKDLCIEKQKDFRGYKSDAFNQVASIPVNLHYYWMNTEDYDFTDFKTHPWSETVKKIKKDNLSHFFTVPNGGYS